MLGRVVWGSRTWMCTIAAPALAASMADCAICWGVTGTAGFLPGVSAEPVTAQEIITFRAIGSSHSAALCPGVAASANPGAETIGYQARFSNMETDQSDGSHASAAGNRLP